LELHGILCAVLFFYWEIDFVNKPVVVITDSLSVQKLFARARQGKELSLDRRINDQIVKLLNFDIEIVYQKGVSTQIHLADLLSRNDTLLKECTDNCAICGLAKDKFIGSAKELGKDWVLVCFDYNPRTSPEKLEEIFALRDNTIFEWESEKLVKQTCYSMNTLKNEIDEVVLRSRNKRLERKVKKLKNGRMPGPKDRKAESLRSSTFVCDLGKPGILV
jgi:hypothetical protein